MSVWENWITLSKGYERVTDGKVVRVEGDLFVGDLVLRV